MKNIYKYVVVAIASLSAISCDTVFSEEEMPQQFVPMGEIVMDDIYRNLTFCGNADSQEITFYANDDWKILTTQDWVSFSENMGVAGEHTITIFVEKSDVDVARESSLTFVVERLRDSFIIEQAKGNIILPEQSSYGLFTTAAQSFDVGVKYNAAFDISCDFGENATVWLCVQDEVTSVAAPAALDDMSLPFELLENTTYNDREVIVSLHNDLLEVKEEFVVSQAGRVPVVLGDYETIRHTYAATDEAVTVVLDAAIDFDISSSVSWITPTRVSFGSGKYTFNYTLEKNDDKEATRTGYIYLKNSAENVERKITLTQDEYNDDATITVTAADELSAKITEYLADSSVEKSDYNRLYIVGNGVALSDGDFTAITANFTNVKLIDISATATTEIPASKFQAKTSLQQFIFPATIESIGRQAFMNSGLTSVVIPGDSKCVTIAYRSFYNISTLESVVIEDGVVELGAQSFSTLTALTSLSLPSSITSWIIGVDGENKSFVGCTALKTLTLPEGLSTLGSQSFSNSGVEEVYIPGSVDFSLSVNSVGDNKAFGTCTSLTKVVFGDGLKAISNNPFTSCSLLAAVIMPEEVPTGTTLGSGAGSNATGALKMYVPADSYDDYVASSWNSSYSIYSIDDYIE